MALRDDALLAIASHYGRAVECMPDLRPVKTGPCGGNLQIDHRYSAYARDSGYKLYKDIVEGRRNLQYFRVLCAHHNQSRKGGEGRLDD